MPGSTSRSDEYVYPTVGIWSERISWEGRTDEEERHDWKRVEGYFRSQT
jgi:hypothetical protein